MSDINELKDNYLAQALEGAEGAQQQLVQARAQMEAQMEQLAAQEAEVANAIVELKQCLGLEDEVEDQES